MWWSAGTCCLFFDFFSDFHKFYINFTGNLRISERHVCLVVLKSARGRIIFILKNWLNQTAIPNQTRTTWRTMSRSKEEITKTAKGKRSWRRICRRWKSGRLSKDEQHRRHPTRSLSVRNPSYDESKEKRRKKTLITPYIMFPLNTAVTP